ncbi:MAG TPA: histidine kinase dimerization/phospho-acceptor domain-containing protein, partial [Ktedonobacterales bacterium]|nr:histidine kinase dimerization/phospho-acceptor domain-containing protein [Ktedonobacterales bacterium]
MPNTTAPRKRQKWPESRHAGSEASAPSSAAKDPPAESTQQALSASILEMVSNLGHELLSPLASIIGYAETLQRVGDRLSPEEQRDFLQAILESGSRLDLLIKRLLELAHSQNHTLRLDNEPIDLVVLAHQSLAKVKRLAAQTGRAFTFRLRADSQVEELDERAAAHAGDDMPYSTLGDPQRLGFVFEHLLENAIKFTPTGGLIEARIEL